MGFFIVNVPVIFWILFGGFEIVVILMIQKPANVVNLPI